MRHILWATGLVAILAGCNDTNKKENAPSNDQQTEWSENRKVMEERASGMLFEARQAMQQKNYEAARTKIEAMRKECYLALTARERGITLLDSVNLCEALDRMTQANDRLKSHPEAADSLNAVIKECDRQIKFYRRKIQYNKQER